MLHAYFSELQVTLPPGFRPDTKIGGYDRVSGSPGYINSTVVQFMRKGINRQRKRLLL